MLAPLTITQIDVNATTGGIAGTLEVQICANTRVGNEQNAVAWTAVSTGDPLVTQPTNPPTTCPLITPIQLAPGRYVCCLGPTPRC